MRRVWARWSIGGRIPLLFLQAALETLEDLLAFFLQRLGLEETVRQPYFERLQNEKFRNARARGKNFHYNRFCERGWNFELKYTDPYFRRLTGFHKSQLDRIVESLKIPSNITKFALTPSESSFS